MLGKDWVGTGLGEDTWQRSVVPMSVGAMRAEACS